MNDIQQFAGGAAAQASLMLAPCALFHLGAGAFLVTTALVTGEISTWWAVAAFAFMWGVTWRQLSIFNSALLHAKDC